MSLADNQPGYPDFGPPSEHSSREVRSPVDDRQRWSSALGPLEPKIQHRVARLSQMAARQAHRDQHAQILRVAPSAGV